MSESRNKKYSAARILPAYLIYRHRKFLILNSPSNETIESFIQELKQRNAKCLVRVCEATYNTELVESEGISVLHWPFEDGSGPSPEIIKNWLHHIRKIFKEDPDNCIAVHCETGLGRASVLVALALIDLGMTSEDAIEFIRRYRPGAMNQRQLEFLREYETKSCIHSYSCLLM